MKARVERIQLHPSDFSAYFKPGVNSEFWCNLSHRTEFEYTTIFQSGRAGIYNVLNSLELQEHDEVLLPAYTCYAVASAVEEIATPVFVDVDPVNFTIDVSDLKNKITEDSSVIIPVHLFGNTCDMPSIAKVAANNNLIIIEDAAQALGTLVLNDKIGTHSDYCIFSLRFSKEITSKGGGIVLSNQPMANIRNGKKSDFLTLLGLVSIFATDTLFNLMPGKLYDIIRRRILTPLFTSSSQELGPLESIEIQNRTTKLLENQLDKLQTRVNRRRQNAQIYNQILSDLVTTPKIKNDHSYFRYSILVENDRDDLIAQLRRRGIGCSKMYSYSLPNNPQTCPVSANIAKKIINLPVHSKLKEKQICDIGEEVNSLV
ncbi:hypothetical protein GS429_07235 [Natronorubrum sp. JWXQ-INN-674]|uniref:dTDP-4-amino-4,6-dideoxygalactose transaminase n=1 Tax=Natronorubrum halalkaliphilum TaxID=2691917 RepID=A0A6B0VJ30_9EURY|nr:DegT/DnrJ/EryC1/StrS family aminotransferase [Natronorubrum halalkaliphilum]MXV61861.1 hypothetical protein [Natronorubrum halalkaliphilum]